MPAREAQGAGMIALFTDFGADDLYVGQMKAVLARYAPAIPVIDLLHTAPPFHITASAHLLAALYHRTAPGSVICAVVDPGVGSAREAVVLAADGYYFVAPDNGLLAVIAARVAQHQVWRIQWRPSSLSPSFHGRDLFAPIAAWIASEQFPSDKLQAVPELAVRNVADDLAQIIYVDRYGNCLTGVRGSTLAAEATLRIGDMSLRRARIFSDVAPGTAFWYENSLGLAEITVNSGNAAQQYELRVGDSLRFE